MASSRVWELVWKRMCTWRQMPRSTCWGRRKAQQKVKERWCEKISCDIEGVYTIGLCISRFSSEKVHSTWTRKIGIKAHRQILQGHLASNLISGKKGSSRGIIQVCASEAQSLRANIRGKITWGNLAPRKMRPQSSVGFGEHIYKLKNSDRTTFFSPVEAKVMPASTSKRPEEREVVVDSRASMHMMSKKE